MRLTIVGLFGLLASSTAIAASTPTGEFVGDVLETWESHPGGFPECYDIDSATVCSEGGGIHGTSGWGYICGISPYADGRLMGNNGEASVYTFDTPVQQFGGYWGTNSGTGDAATFTFYNALGGVVGSEIVMFGDCGTWTWAGWTFSEGVTSIRIDFAPTHLMSDNLTYDFGGGIGGVELGLDGDCPGEASIDITGTPGGDFVIVAGDMEGSTVIPRGPCAGLDLGIQNSSGVLTKFGPIPDSDGDGMIHMTPTVPGGICDKKFVVVDLDACSVSAPQMFTPDVAPNPECTEYTEISDAYRNVDWVYDYARCDNGLAAGWYRFTGEAGSQMLDYAPGDYSCGTHASGWIDGHPMLTGETSAQTVCYDWSGDPENCTWSHEISVTNCGPYYVYDLIPTPWGCSGVYCGM